MAEVLADSGVIGHGMIVDGVVVAATGEAIAHHGPGLILPHIQGIDMFLPDSSPALTNSDLTGSEDEMVVVAAAVVVVIEDAGHTMTRIEGSLRRRGRQKFIQGVIVEIAAGSMMTLLGTTKVNQASF